MKKLIALFVAVCLGCEPSASHVPTQQSIESTNTKATPSTSLSVNTIYYYRSVFPEFKERLQWIATTDKKKLTLAADEARKEQLWWKDIAFSSLSGNPISLAWSCFGMGRTETGRPKILFWASPISDPTDTPLANYFERRLRSLPKLEADGTWDLKEIESIDFDLDDPATTIFQEMASYNLAGRGKTEQAQSQASPVASATALIFRKSDSSILFINGIKWNHPLYADGYTEFQLHISQKTGAVINDSYAYTNFPLEPGQFSQYASIAKTTADAILLARQLMGR